MLADEIIEKIPEVSKLYHRLILVVAPAGGGKTTALKEVAQRTGYKYINVNLELSGRLLELTAKQRPLRAPVLLGEVVEAAGSEVILLDNLEILFAPALQLDPLRLLQGLARNRTVVAAWNGFVQNGQLIYAELGHPEYRRYATDDLVVLVPRGTPVPGASARTVR